MEHIKHCLYSNWCENYKKISFRTEALELSKKEFKFLYDNFENNLLEKVTETTLPRKIKQKLACFPNGAFIKLETRSPKNNYHAETINYRQMSWQDVIKSLYSERIIDDLVEYAKSDVPCRLLFREWLPIPKHEEFRVFIKNKKVAGITQYFYEVYSDKDKENQPYTSKVINKLSSYIEKSINDFLDKEILPHLPSSDLVVDLWFNGFREMKLIETNPYGLSDPCLLNYEELEKIGFYEFRYIKVIA
jgi:hypothetical protein